MTGKFVSDLTLILLSDFIGYKPRSRKNALSRLENCLQLDTAVFKLKLTYKRIYIV